ncbi:MAG: hypothetical protein ACKVQA_07925, partial [Burkholderiales bacterium]
MKNRCLLLMLFVCGTAVQVCEGSTLGAESAAKDCPDLTGTYVALRPAWIDQFHLHVTGTLRPTTQTRQFATFQRRTFGYTLIWHMPREDVLAGARRLAERDPRNFGFWRDMALGEQELLLPSGSTTQSWVNQMARYGPVFRVDAALPIKECLGGWGRVETHGRNGPPDVEGGMDGTRDVTLWLRREKDGSLGLRWEERRKVVLITSGRYTQEFSVPLWSAEHFDQWPAVPTPDLSPLRGDELPPRNRPKGQLLKCQLDPALESQFFARLAAHLPEKAAHVNGSHGFYQGRIRPDDSCEPMPFFVTIKALNAEDIAKVEAVLKSDPFFER